MRDLSSVESVDLLWAKYKTSQSVELRNRLICHYRPLVIGIAHHMMLTMSPNIEEDDLISYGIFGLLDAIQKYEPARGLQFNTYARYRIRGAIFDEMRAADWVPRSVRISARQFQIAQSLLASELLREPTSLEIAKKLKISMSAYLEMAAKILRTKTLSTDELKDSDQFVLDNSLASFENAELANMISLLPEPESSVISLYYFNDLMFKEIGIFYGFTESWACLVHRRGIKLLQSQLI